jgi:hypothetical protein
MDNRLSTLNRVRALRARIALNEVSQRRQAEAQSQAALEYARHRQAQYEERADQMSALLAAQSLDGACLSAAQAQDLLCYATAARLQAQEAATPIRRAQLQLERARVAADEARSRYRRAATRLEVTQLQWKDSVRSALRLQAERDDQSGAEERASAAQAAALDGGR